MSEWKKVKLDDCLELITYGFTNPMPDTLSGPWKVTAKDINNGRIVFETARHTSQEAFDNDLTDKSRPKKGDILLTKDGTLGRLAIVGDERVCINQSVALLRVNKDILSVPYLYYLLSTPLYQAKMIADAGTVLSQNEDALKNGFEFVRASELIESHGGYCDYIEYILRKEVNEGGET